MKKFDKKEFWEKKIINWENGRYGKNFQNLGLLEKISDKFSSSLIYRQFFANNILQKHISNKIIVELGCGSGFLSDKIIKGGAKYYHGYDISEEAIKRAKELSVKNGISNKVTFYAKSINDLTKLKADIIFSLGTLDWLDDDERENLYKISNGSECLHSISEKRNSLSQYLHRFYVNVSYGLKSKGYKPIYLNAENISKKIEKYSKKKVYIYRDKKLSFGTFISTLKLDSN